MQNILKNKVAALLLAAVTFLGISCTKSELTDGDKFMLFYPDVTDIGPSTNMYLDPTYHGPTPTDFKVYQVKYEGSPIKTSCFQINAETGRLSIVDTDDLLGLYSISISCISDGKLYEYPDVIKVNMMKPIPEGISVEPSLIELLMTQVNNVASTEVLPTAQVITDGDHITIKSYRIANIWKDGNKVEDWSGFFMIDEKTGLISVLKNSNFMAGTYVFDLKLITKVVSMDSEEGFYPNALTVDIVSPPVSLVYNPEIKRVEEGTGYVSSAPLVVASAKDLNFSIKSLYPENTPLTIDSSTGVITLSDQNELKSGDKVQVSIRVTNAYGTKDFDQVTRIDIVDFIQPISKISYNDSTVWHGTGYSLKPVEVDGDDVKFSFVDLPEALSEQLSIDELTGQITAVKGNEIEKGEYTVTVKVVNDKGEMTDDIAITVVDNPYFFTKVSWGNNLNLTPVGDYASQHRVSLSEDTEISVVKDASDITEEGWKNVSFEMIDGSLRLGSDAKIDASTGVIKVMPSYIAGKGIAFKRTHLAMIKVTVGVGTSGETSMKVPVFFDFNAPRVDSGNPNAPVYTIEFNPFVFQCNPKKGGSFIKPVIKDENGNEISAEEYADVTMTFLGYSKDVHPYYWNLGGPETHLDGNMSVEGGFLHQMWTSFYKSIGKSPAFTNVNPLYSYLTDAKMIAARFAYMQNTQLENISAEDHLKLYVVPEKWVDDYGQYADGVLMAQVRVGYMDKTGARIEASAAKNPYQMYPFFIWFDTEF